ncbi:DUF5696 domain-containing protein [Haploplasma axanthum]|uniref:Uncharacterized protein n=1 Tax=Haploplasma axanthum TaxID=29552 RepID=A0A449BEI6_HAPAX|nr:DUF5696 domain-containing protein [Haploplasma axanthum]VEU80720.1 Uncharacterised protein [Haploplasma axanthum]
MSRKIKRSIVAILLVVFTSITVNGMSKKNASIFNTYEDNNSNFSYIEDSFLSSSRFTQLNKVTEAEKEQYNENYKIRYANEKLDLLGYELALSNESYDLYFENDSYSIVIVNKTTGFVWSSRAEFQEYSDGNNNARHLMNSGIWIDYVKTNTQNLRQTTTSIYSAAKVTYLNNEDVPTELKPYVIKNDSYDKNLMEIESEINTSNKTITSLINFKELKISFKVNLTLSENGINVNLDNSTILENDINTKLTNIYIFPYLGSTRENKVPGYFMIPDGIGALVRLNRQFNKDFNARYYGNDLGYNEGYLPELSLPIFGIVHLENENALYAKINEGAENVVLQGRFWGASSRYFRLNPRYIVRQVYKTIIDRKGNGYDSLLDQKTTSNLNIDYKFLTGEEANYVGIAKDYQEFLNSINVLTKRELTGNGIPLNINYLMSDREDSFLGTKKVTMTTVSQVEEIYNEFKNNGITNQQVNLQGYSTSGNRDRAPYKISVIESKNNFKKLAELVKNDDNNIYFENNYLVSTNYNNRISYNRDVARNVSQTRMAYDRYDLNDSSYKKYYLYPEQSLRLAKQDVKKVNDLLISGLTIDDETNNLYSTYKSGNYIDRTMNLVNQRQIFELYENMQMRFPHLYALEYAKTFLDVPITNSQYDFYTDLIPLIPLVLKGYISYFTPNINYNALGIERLLMMVDFAINPSFVLTYSPTYKMRYTLSYTDYSTSYSDYKDEVIETYNFVNDALKNVIGATIIERNILGLGIVEVKYSNNVKIYINYTSKNFTYNNISIPASNYKVVQ